MILILLSSLVFSTTHVDLGTLKDTDVPQVATFTYVNGGNAPLRISRVSTSCGCTYATMQEEKKLAPGEAGILQFVFNPRNQIGDVEVQCTVYSNDEPGQILRISAHVEEAAPFSHYKIGMGALRLRTNSVTYLNHGPQVERIAVGNTGSDTLRISATQLPQGVSLRCEPEAIPPGGEADIVIRMDDRKRSGTQTLLLEGLDIEPSQRTININAQ